MRDISPGQVDLETAPTKATVIIMRPSVIAFGMTTSVFDLRPDETRFVGIVPAHKKLVYRTEPGETRFMMISASEDFLDATLVAGRTYYVAIMPRPGSASRLRLLPVNEDQSDLLRYENDLSWVENTDESRKWGAAVVQGIDSRRIVEGEEAAPQEQNVVVVVDRTWTPTPPDPVLRLTWSPDLAPKPPSHGHNAPEQPPPTPPATP
jgi:hypothetical protein